MIKNHSNSKITIKFTEKEVGIIKASLQYFVLDDDFGSSLWFLTPGATWGRSDNYYLFLTLALQKKINKASRKINADFGYWGDIKRLADLCQKEYLRAKKERKQNTTGSPKHIKDF